MKGNRDREAGYIRRGSLVILVVMLAIMFFILYNLARDLEISVIPSETSITASSDTMETDNDVTGRLTRYNGKWYRKKERLETFLLIGLDKNAEYASQESDYRNTQQADFLMLVIFDRQNNTLSALHINRDTMADIWQLDVTGRAIGTFKGQLALSHTYGNNEVLRCQYVVRAVSKFLYGVHIDHYISFTMDAVTILNDLCGGVTVKLADDFSDAYEGFTEGAVVTLQGEQALSYVRARSGLEDSTNLHRMERQRQYLDALSEVLKAKYAADGDFAENALSKLGEYLYSDCTLLQLSRYAEYALAETYTGIETVAGEAKKGEEFMEFYADENALQEQMIHLFYDEA